MLGNAIVRAMDAWAAMTPREQRLVMAVLLALFLPYAYTHGWLNLEGAA